MSTINEQLDSAVTALHDAALGLSLDLTVSELHSATVALEELADIAEMLVRRMETRLVTRYATGSVAHNEPTGDVLETVNDACRWLSMTRSGFSATSSLLHAGVQSLALLGDNVEAGA